MSELAPPSDLDAEAILLSAAMLDPANFDRVAHIVGADRFYADRNRFVWSAIGELAGAGKPTDAAAVASLLRDRGRLEAIGGAAYLGEILGAPFALNLEHYAGRVTDQARLRAVIGEARAIAAEAAAGPEDVTTFVQSAEARIFAAAGQETRTVTSESASEVMRGCLTEIAKRFRKETPSGHSTGFKALDRRIGGLRAGRMYVGAGRPGMGKTSFLTQVIRSVCTAADSDRRGVLFASLEMPRDQIGERLISQEAMLDTRKVELGMLTRAEWSSVTKVSAEIAKWPLIVEDRAALTVSMLRSTIRRSARRLEIEFGTKLGLVGLDYLQLMGDSDLPRGLNDNSRIERQSAALKDISKEFGVPVVALSQLNRDCEKRPNKRPQLSDLRSSGAIEQDAHTIVFFYRDDVYKPAEAVKDNQAEFIVAKCRGGRTGAVNVGFAPYCTKFVDLEDYEDEDELTHYQREEIEDLSVGFEEPGRYP